MKTLYAVPFWVGRHPVKPASIVGAAGQRRHRLVIGARSRIFFPFASSTSDASRGSCSVPPFANVA